MRQFLSAIAMVCLLPASVAAQSVLDQWRADPTQIFDAADVELDTLIWEVRPLVVFAQSPNDPQFQRQMDLLTARGNRKYATAGPKPPYDRGTLSPIRIP